jgi:hypothetical protein
MPLVGFAAFFSRFFPDGLFSPSREVCGKNFGEFTIPQVFLVVAGKFHEKNKHAPARI